MSTKSDIRTTGVLATEIVPKITIFVIFYEEKDKINVLTRDGILPLFPFPPEQNTYETQVIDGPFAVGENTPFYTIEVDKYTNIILSSIIFQSVKVDNLDFWRANFTEQILVIETKIQPDYKFLDVMKDCKFNTYNNIDDIYTQTILHSFS